MSKILLFINNIKNPKLLDRHILDQKEEPKKKTSNYIMRAETGDKQVKVKDRIVADEQK